MHIDIYISAVIPGDYCAQLLFFIPGDSRGSLSLSIPGDSLAPVPFPIPGYRRDPLPSLFPLLLSPGPGLLSVSLDQWHYCLSVCVSACVCLSVFTCQFWWWSPWHIAVTLLTTRTEISATRLRASVYFIRARFKPKSNTLYIFARSEIGLSPDSESVLLELLPWFASCESIWFFFIKFPASNGKLEYDSVCSSVFWVVDMSSQWWRHQTSQLTSGVADLPHYLMVGGLHFNPNLLLLSRLRK